LKRSIWFICFLILVFPVLVWSQDAKTDNEYPEDTDMENGLNQRGPARDKGRAGVGVGIPYGGIGVNLEIKLNDYFALTTGIGSMKNYLSLIGGVKVYMFSAGHYFRPRISVYYGNIGVIANKVSDGLSGSAFGVGFDRKISNSWSIDFDVLKTFYSVPKGVLIEGGDTKISAGINYHYENLRHKK